eukprot:GHVL01038298.1.p1 GENE.GHVL01038298.1~~GHVL01038298.1.p1  ORF type:complete len:352 (-),score=45.67 GHVL01038298.1:884-1939(-)
MDLAFFSDILSSDADLNKQFHDWNKLVLPSCDGSAFLGTKTTSVHDLWLTGALNFMSTLREVRGKGLDNNDEILITGCGSGGVAAMHHIDRLRSMYLNSFVVGLIDSGFLQSTLELVPGPAVTFNERIKIISEEHAMKDSFNGNCVAQFDDAHACIFGENVSQSISSPVFFIQSIYDSWQTSHEFGPHQDVAISKFGQALYSKLETSVIGGPKQRTQGGFIDSCVHHCGTWGNISINGQTSKTTFDLWYQDQKDNWIKQRDSANKNNNDSIKINSDLHWSRPLQRQLQKSDQSCPRTGLCVETYPFPCTECCASSSKYKSAASFHFEASGDYGNDPWGRPSQWIDLESTAL